MARADSYISHPSATAEVIKTAELAHQNFGMEQWIHHHPHGHLCNHECGPLQLQDAPPAAQR